MNCITAIGLMSAYVERLLPESTARAVRFHLQVCTDCHTEYMIWKESSKVFKRGMNLPSSDQQSIASPSMADQIMARISMEGKKPRPVLKVLTSGMKRFATSLAVLFLLVFSVMMVGSFHHQPPASLEKAEWKELSRTDIVLSIDDMHASPDKDTVSRDNRYRIVASIGDPLHIKANVMVPTPNVGLVLGFFGIMVTVVSMSWFSRN